MSDLLAYITRWAVEVVYSFGYLGVGFLVVLSTLHLPVPSQLVLALAGFWSTRGASRSCRCWRRQRRGR